MANIIGVNYEAIPGIAAQMRSKGEELNREMTTTYESIAEMHNSWYGKRYNELVVGFNGLSLKINELLDLVVGEVPFKLETIANNYANADKGETIVSANKTAPNKIVELAMLNDTGMKFITNEVETVKTNVSNNFKESKELMSAIETIYNQIEWQSEAADAFRTKFINLKNDIITSFEEIETQFTTLMEQALQDIQATENANTVQ